MTSNELEIFKQSILDDVRVMMQTTGQVTQYIGARYVPLFADPLDWSNTKEYEPLTIVLYQGNSFTSRQFVPKGIDISDESFWANTGNYNAQIEQYRQEVAAFDGRITENSRNIERVERELSDSKKDKSVMLVFGDSFSVEYSGEGGSTGPLWWELVSKELSMEPDSFAVSGAGFIKYYSVSMDSEFEKAKSKYNTPELIASVKRVYIFAGLNDLVLKGVTSDFWPAVNRFIAKVKAYFTSAYVTYTSNITPDPIARQRITLQSFNDYCKFKSNMAFMFDYISGATELFRNDNGEDFLHPNANGEAFIADMMLGRGVEQLCYSNSPSYFGNLQNCTIAGVSLAKKGKHICGNIQITPTDKNSPCSFTFPSYVITNALFELYAPVYKNSVEQLTLAKIQMSGDNLTVSVPAVPTANTIVYLPLNFILPTNQRV